MMVGGELVLLKPRKVHEFPSPDWPVFLTRVLQSGDQEVRYDMQILADRIEFCWIHLRGIGSLENSLWGYDGQSMRVWLNALTIEAPSESVSEPQSRHVRESVNVPLDFYPLCRFISSLLYVLAISDSTAAVLMDKGIIIGAEHESSVVSTLPFVTFRHATSVRQRLAVDEMNLLIRPIVAFVSASYSAFSSGSRPSTRGGLLRVALPTPGFLRTCSRNSPSHGRRVRSDWGGFDDERGGQQPSSRHRVFGSFRCRP
jgi:hypothetical protein